MRSSVPAHVDATADQPGHRAATRVVLALSAIALAVGLTACAADQRHADAQLSAAGRESALSSVVTRPAPPSFSVPVGRPTLMPASTSHPAPAPKPKPKPTTHPAPPPPPSSRVNPAPAYHASVARVAATQQTAARTATTFAQRVAAAVAQLPGGGEGAVFHPYANPQDFAWGITDLAACVSWINPATPTDKIVSVVDHEFGHILQCRAYGGNVAAEIAAAGSMSEIERIADAVALDEGATWTNYTSSPTSREREAASNLLAGRKMF